MPLINVLKLSIDLWHRCALFVVLLSVLFVPAMGYSQGLRAIIDTSKGTIEVNLNERAAPPLWPILSTWLYVVFMTG